MVRGDSFKTKLSTAAIAILFALNGAFPTSAFAAGAVSTICRDAKGSVVNDKQCSAAKDLQSGAKANKSVAAVWTGVSVVCAAACLNWAGTGACTASNVGGNAASTVIQKDFAGGLTSLGGNAVNSLLGKKKEEGATQGAAAETATNAASDTAVEGSQQAARKNGAGPCMTAAQTTSQSVRKFKDATQNENQLGDLKKSADAMNSGGGTNVGKPVFGSGITGNQPVQSAASAGSGTTTTADGAGANDPCSEASIKTAQGALACAGKYTRDLPPDVTSGRFLADLEKVTGKPADQFFAEFKDPVTTIAQEIGGRLPAENQNAFANGLGALAREAASMPSTGTMVASAGHAGKGYDSGYDDPLAGMQDALNGLMQGAAGQNEQPGAGNEIRAGSAAANRAPAFVSPEDKTISIFDRVKWRYGALIQRERMGE